MHPDWKWLIIGILVAMFVIPFVTNLVSRKPASPANS